MITRHSTSNEFLAAMRWFFGEMQGGYREYLKPLLEDCQCNLVIREIEDKDGETALWFLITLLVPPDQLVCAENVWTEVEIGKALNVMVNENLPIRSQLRIKVLPPEASRTVGLNNCFFKKEQTILHDDLRFRSKAEIAIYEELKRRDVLFFPNPAAVLGMSALEYGATVVKKEPDFLICYKGKWGILEINHDAYHSGIISTAKDHERARKFHHYGVFFIQAYEYDKCRVDAVGVVDEFLKLLANHK